MHPYVQITMNNFQAFFLTDVKRRETRVGKIHAGIRDTQSTRDWMRTRPKKLVYI